MSAQFANAFCQIKPETLNIFFMVDELFFHKYDLFLFCEMVLIGVMVRLTLLVIIASRAIFFIMDQAWCKNITTPKNTLRQLGMPKNHDKMDYLVDEYDNVL
jgi:hypothetical protein